MPITYRLIIRGVFALSLVLATVVFAQPAEVALQGFREKYGENIQVTLNPTTRLPERIGGLNVFLPGLEARVTIGKDDVVGSLLSFIHENRQFFAIDTGNLKLARADKIGERWYVIFGQQYEDLSVYHVKVGAVVTDSGKIISFSSNYIPGIEVSLIPEVTITSAGKIARTAYTRENPRTTLPRDWEPKDEELIIYPQVDSMGYDLHLAWYFLMQGELTNPEVDHYFIVDAMNGEILLKYPAYVEADISGMVQGWVHPVNPNNPPISLEPFSNEDVEASGSSATTNASGNYTITGLSPGTYTVSSRLEGPYAHVWDHSNVEFTHSQSCATSSSCSWDWDEDPATTVQEEDGINVFYHLNLLHDEFYQVILGYNWTNAWTGTSQMLAKVNTPFYDNAHAGSPMEFGSDCFALSSDIVYHEASHNVIYSVFGDWIGFSSGRYNEGYAMDEGFADYFASAFTNDPLHGEGCGGGRDLDNTDLYVLPYNLEGHTGGMIISGAAWDLRTDYTIGADAIDNLVFQALNTMATKSDPYYFSDPNHSNLFESILEADDDNANLADGTPHDRQIFQSFRNHDLLPYDVYSKDSPSDDGNVGSPSPHWRSPDISVDAMANYTGTGFPPHENPELGNPNNVHVRVRNLGYLTVPQCVVKLYYANPSTGFSWAAGHWTHLGDATITNIPAGGEKTDIIPWTPSGTGTGHRCLFVRIECSDDIITEDGNVRQDNNVTQKNINIVNLQSAFTTDFYLHPLPEGVEAERNLKIFYVDAPTDHEITTVLELPRRINVEGKTDSRVIRRRKGCLGILFGGKWEVTAKSTDTGAEVVVPDFSCEKTEKVKLTIQAPDGVARTRDFTIRIVEEWNGEVIGGLDYLVRP